MLAFYMNLIDNEEDQAKFERVYRQYRSRMKYFAIQYVHDEFLAEDIVDEAFIRVARHIDGVEENESHKTNSFIVTIVRRLCLDTIEYQKKRNVTYVGDPDTELLPKIKGPFSFEEIDFSELLDKIRNLPEIYREVLMLKFHHGYSDREIADMFEISMPTVRKRIERARDLLWYSLKEWRK